MFENQDLLLHFIGSAVISMLLFLVGVKPFAVLLIVLAVGVGKEALDANGFGTASVSDMLANVFGMMGMFVLFHLVRASGDARQEYDAQGAGARGAQLSLAMQRARKKSKSRRKGERKTHYKVVIYESEEEMERAHAARAAKREGSKVDFRSQSLRKPDGRPFH